MENCSVFDRCHTARFRVSGKGTFEKIKLLLEINDDIITQDKVFRSSGADRFDFIAMAEDDGLLLAGDRNALSSLQEKLAGLEICDLSDDLAHLDIAGAKLESVLEEFDIAPEEIPLGNQVLKKCVAEVNAILIQSVRFKTPAVTLIFNAEYAEGMWEEFVETYPVKPAGFSAYDALTEE